MVTVEMSKNIEKTGSPGKTRTCDKAVNSRLLYQLSYRGSKPQEPEDGSFTILPNFRP